MVEIHPSEAVVVMDTAGSGNVPHNLAARSSGPVAIIGKRPIPIQTIARAAMGRIILIGGS